MSQNAPININRSINIILFCQLTIGFGHSILLTLLPQICRKIGISDEYIGFIFAIAAIILVITAPIAGALSDRYGRKPFIVIGMIGYALAAFIFGYVSELGLEKTITPLVAFFLLASSRVIYAILSSGITPAATGFILDVMDKSEHTPYIGKLQAFMGLGMILGPVLGYYAVDYGLIIPLYISVIVAIFASLLALLWLNEPVSQNKTGEVTKLKIFDPRIIVYLFIGFSVYFCLAGVQLISGLFLQDHFNLTVELVVKYSSVMMVVAAISMIAVQVIVVGKLKIHAYLLLKYGVLTAFIGFSIFFFASNIFIYWAAIGVFAAGLGAVGPGFVGAATMSVRQNETGGVAGLASACQAFGFISAPGLMTMVYTWNIYAPFVILTTLMGALTIFVFFSNAINISGEIAKP